MVEVWRILLDWLRDGMGVRSVYSFTSCSLWNAPQSQLFPTIPRRACHDPLGSVYSCSPPTMVTSAVCDPSAPSRVNKHPVQIPNMRLQEEINSKDRQQRISAVRSSAVRTDSSGDSAGELRKRVYSNPESQHLCMREPRLFRDYRYHRPLQK
ncbi:hypothetical protein L226DRAFT_246470 [Lentinus tigrinus ALCF2SS1-7]|uniref:Uncharacterized protein n=1 Tax=Lentinus tigrinus ALCF2SS1-6 TaxID=1328759 RepID=A0A5C2SNE1_9APHY|nr:hypothetical protein L227DRAFT_207188 [Lentinus tigrinus ALCF2SS1-6]RPD79308.1 hypothetical protein L226DRAFT_246470 [Lentinus tigrinus ALCF2SS1-7]